MRRIAIAIAACWTFGLEAHAQGRLTSSGLTPAEASSVFQSAVSDACISSVSQGVRLAQIPPDQRGDIGVNRDLGKRKILGAAPEETVWEARRARGAVTVRETFGRCVVEASNAQASSAVLSLADALVASGFEKMASPAGRSGPVISLFRIDGKRRIQVILEAREPRAGGEGADTLGAARATVFASPAR